MFMCTFFRIRLISPFVLPPTPLAAVVWPKFRRYGVKYYIINQSTLSLLFDWNISDTA